MAEVVGRTVSVHPNYRDMSPHLCLYFEYPVVVMEVSVGKHTLPRYLKLLAKILKEQGWTYDFTSKGHPRFNPPKGWKDPSAFPVTTGKTPSDRRAGKNLVAQLRRMGVDIPQDFTIG